MEACQEGLKRFLAGTRRQEALPGLPKEVPGRRSTVAGGQQQHSKEQRKGATPFTKSKYKRAGQGEGPWQPRENLEDQAKFDRMSLDSNMCQELEVQLKCTKDGNLGGELGQMQQLIYQCNQAVGVALDHREIRKIGIRESVLVQFGINRP